MADTKVKFSIGADTSELERAFGTLIKKIQSDADKLKLSPNAAKMAPNAQISGDREQARNKTFVDAQAKQYRDILKSLKEQFNLLQQIGREREKQQRQEFIANAQKANFIQTQRAQNYGISGGVRGQPPSPPQQPPRIPSTPPAGGGGNIPAGGITSIQGLAGMLGIPAGIIGGAITGIAAGSAAESIRKFFGEASYRAKEAQSQAFNIQGQPGQLLSSAISGGGIEDMLFAPQRERAAKMAEEEMKGRMESSFRIFKRPIQTIFGAANNGYEPGNQLGLGTEAQKTLIASQQQIERAEEQRSLFEAIKKGPESAVITDITNKFAGDWRRNLDFQRKTGLSEKEFRNFVGGVNSGGFTEEQGMGMAGTILGAGGSTRAARGNAGFALQMGRQFDLTNAGQAMGALSGQLGTAQLSKDALISIQAEGVRKGLNASDMREENRKFVEMAANVINQSNATSGAGIDQVLSTFSKFMSGATTMSGLQAGQGAYEAYQRQSNIQSGPSAVMRAAGMRSDSMIGKLSERDRGILSTMPESEITPDSPVIQEMVNRTKGTTVEGIVGNYHKVIGQSLFVNPTTDAAISRLRKAQKAISGPMANGENYGSQLNEERLAAGGAAGQEALEQMFAGANEKQRLAGARAIASQDYSGMDKIREDIRKQTESGGLPRLGDEMEKRQSEASRMANELFTSIQPSIEAAAKQTAIFTANINALVIAMKSGDANAINAAQRNLYNQTPSNHSPQDQTHASSGGPPAWTMPGSQGPSWSGPPTGH